MAMNPRSLVNISISFTGGMTNDDLEFARKIRLSVERIDEVLVLGVVEVELNVIDPDGMIRACVFGATRMCYLQASATLARGLSCKPGSARR